MTTQIALKCVDLFHGFSAHALFTVGCLTNRGPHPLGTTEYPIASQIVNKNIPLRLEDAQESAGKAKIRSITVYGI